MKTITNLTLITGTTLAIAFAVASWSPAQAEPEAKMKMEKMMKKDGQMPDCQAMMDQKEKMVADTKAQDAELATRIAAMNSAPDDKKMAMMAAVITRMAEQQATMHAKKAEMEAKMMPHMMEHMQMGKDSMAKCPMMKMKGMDEKPSDVSGEQPAEKE